VALRRRVILTAVTSLAPTASRDVRPRPMDASGHRIRTSPAPRTARERSPEDQNFRRDLQEVSDSESKNQCDRRRRRRACEVRKSDAQGAPTRSIAVNQRTLVRKERPDPLK